MPLTIEEVIANGGSLAAFVARVRDVAAALGAEGAPQNAEVYASAIASLLPDLGRLVDQVRADIAD